MLVQPRKSKLGHHREVLSEGDVENRKVHRWMSRPILDIFEEINNMKGLADVVNQIGNVVVKQN